MRKYRKYKNPPLALEKKTITSIIGFSLLAGSLLLFLSFFTQAGVLLSLRDYFYNLFGIGVFFLPLLVVALSLPLLGIKNRFSKINIILGLSGALLSFIGMMSIFGKDFAGLLGSSLWLVFKSLITPIGAFLILFFTFFISLIIAFNTSFDQAVVTIVAIYTKVNNFLKFIRTKTLGLLGARKPKFVIKPASDSYQKLKLPIQSSQKTDEYRGLSSNVVVNAPGQTQVWQYPPLSLLNESRGQAGPTVTQYALEIPMGTKLSKILALQNDLALALATSTGSVRIEAPIPGKSLVGVEIPNLSPEIVSLKSALMDESMRTSKSKLAVALGLDVSGTTVIADLAKMPHVLIAGTTGSGKSVLLNAFIATLLFRASPHEIKLILVDPKRVELSEYNDIPHLLTPVIIEPEKILSALKWAMQEMDRRYKLFHDAQVRNINGYNELSGFQALPYIVIIVDELQNLMEFAPVEVENAIVRLAAMARATGVHLVVATQRPSVDVITGLIKANIPCRIAFNVSSMIDSRVILDQPGAEKLLGKGDMLYVPPDASKPMRIQGIYVSDTEIRNLIAFLKRSGIEPEYTEEVIQMPIGKIAGIPGAKDELFEEAVRTICQYDRASASLLQRRLRIGYARAARLLDELEIAGIVGPGEGSKPRDVLVKDAEEYLQSQAQATS
ncbi:MAG: cell division FtsK/SpoIIIE [Candidatus Curtissbacteria bacterium GW2011_GWA2_41_24]|uniref:Cell division FtsK/SpoIIIE n=1 Tax=Candidatus Curtissbacteria bacterium GW2011_GWA2_41_24 TaxID=1618411 RepID=A0A0G0VYI5_9BACT|nr:MAG: cell division FtsK/SpoIIIE [Candidatus Curtissbacteria bacterium GW2011_GWA2_41_24]